MPQNFRKCNQLNVYRMKKIDCTIPVCDQQIFKGDFVMELISKFSIISYFLMKAICSFDIKA